MWQDEKCNWCACLELRFFILEGIFALDIYHVMSAEEASELVLVMIILIVSIWRNALLHWNLGTIAVQ